jgi:hypothetical protein
MYIAELAVNGLVSCARAALPAAQENAARTRMLRVKLKA